MATFRSNRLTCVPVGCINRIDCNVVQVIQFSHRLVGHVAAQFVHLQDKALCRAGFVPARSPRDRVSSHKESKFHCLE
jgi:hypothetical protein